MKERSILMSGPMPQAIMEDRKTMTRRVVKPQPDHHANSFIHTDDKSEWKFVECFLGKTVALALGDWMKCSYGQPGDLLVFLGTWAAPKEYDKIKPSQLPRDVRIWTVYEQTPKPDWCGRSRPGRFTPKWMYDRFPKGRITNIRVERVQKIGLEDIHAEGIDRWVDCEGGTHISVYQARGRYQVLWDSLNAKRGYSWESNPWVWVIEFERHEQGAKP